MLITTDNPLEVMLQFSGSVISSNLTKENVRITIPNVDAGKYVW